MDDASFEEELRVGAELVRELSQGLPTVMDLLREHEDDNDEILPTLFLNQVGDWFVEAWLARQADQHAFDEAQRFTTRLAQRYSEVGPAEQNMIAVGFLEALPNPGAPNRDCLETLPKVLQEERHSMDFPSSGN